MGSFPLDPWLLNRLEPWHHQRDESLESAVVSMGLEVRHFTAMVMKFEPWEGRHQGRQRREPLPAVRRLPVPQQWCGSMALQELGYGRTGGRRIPLASGSSTRRGSSCWRRGRGEQEDDWASEMRGFWPMGEMAAMRRLEEWLKEAAWGCYFPPGAASKGPWRVEIEASTLGMTWAAASAPTRCLSSPLGGVLEAWTAMLSPYLRFGDLSPRYVDWRVCQASLKRSPIYYYIMALARVALELLAPKSPWNMVFNSHMEVYAVIA